MVNYLENIKRDLEESSSDHVQITVSRKGLERLVVEFETLKRGVSNG